VLFRSIEFHHNTPASQLLATFLQSKFDQNVTSYRVFGRMHHIRRLSVLFAPFILKVSALFIVASIQTTNAWSIPISRRQAFDHAILVSTMIPSWPTQARNLPEDNGADLSNVGTVQALLPIIDIEQVLSTMQSTLTTSPPGILLLPSSIPTNELQFKKIFDAYSIPVTYKQKFRNNNAFLVYYTQGYDGPNRPNLEDLSERELLQQEQYGARNECWLAWNELVNEVEYVTRSGDYSTSDELGLLLNTTIAAVTAYLTLAPNQMEGRTMWQAKNPSI